MTNHKKGIVSEVLVKPPYLYHCHAHHRILSKHLYILLAPLSNPSAPASTRACRNETKELVKSNIYCGLLTDATGSFSSCLASGLVDTNNIYKACEYDMCAYQDTLEEGRVLACSYLGALDLECGKRGFPPHPWRNLSACGTVQIFNSCTS